MILRAIAVLILVAAGALESAAQSTTDNSQKQGSVFLHESFEEHEAGTAPKIPMLQRVEKVRVIKLGAGKVAHFNDSDTSLGGAMEYNVGTSAQESLYLKFDAFNNAPQKGDKSSTVIFAVGHWSPGKSLLLNAKSKRAFGFEMYQQKYLKLRVGNDVVTQVEYDPQEPFTVKIWLNDHDENVLSYQRPDNQEAATLNPDSVVVWLNDKLFGELQSSGTPMYDKITKGNAVIGRVGFSSSSTKVGEFMFDNLHIEDPSSNAESEPDKAAAPSTTEEVTLDRLAGAETMRYRDGENPMNLFVFKPEGWKASDKRSAYIYFFGGGWTKGTPQKSAPKATWAAKNGMVGIAPDYRTKNRFGTSPLASVDDARAALAWVQKHADELGVDPNRIAVGGSSAGGHVALWTAIEKATPGWDPATSPSLKPAALFLTSAVTDTSPESGYTPQRFGKDAMALSPVHHLDAKMPPTVLFHAANDQLVHYSTAVAIHTKLKSNENACELITVPVGGHSFTSEFPQWKSKVQMKAEELFKRTGLLPAVR